MCRCVYYCLGVGLHPNKRKVKTKYRLPLLNWVTIPVTQISGTVFDDLDDERVMRDVDFTEFEETFKTKAQAGMQFTNFALALVYLTTDRFLAISRTYLYFFLFNWNHIPSRKMIFCFATQGAGLSELVDAN